MSFGASRTTLPSWNRRPSDFLTYAAQLADVADRRSPHDRRRRAACRSPSPSRGSVTMYDAGSRWNSLTAWRPALSRYSKRRSTGDDVGRRRRRAADRVQPVVERRRRRVVAGAQRERQRLRRQMLDQLLRLLLLIEVVLQPPALQPRAAVREHRDDVARLDADVALGACRRRAPPRAAPPASALTDGDGGCRRRTGAGRRRPPSGTMPTSPCADAGAGLRDRLHEQRLPGVQHEEREKDGEKNASFHSTGPATAGRYLGGLEPGRGRRRTAGGSGRGAWRPARCRARRRGDRWPRRRSPRTRAGTGRSR